MQSDMIFFFSSRRRHTRWTGDWSSDVCSSDLIRLGDLEVTPLEVVAARLELVRSIEPAEYRREAEESLVLRLRLTNVSRSEERRVGKKCRSRWVQDP